MDITDITQMNDKIKEKAKEARIEAVERFQVPENSQCIQDIDEFCAAMTETVAISIRKIKEGKVESLEDQQRIIGTCAGLISLIDQYKNTRLSVEFARRMKFETCPITASEKSK